MGKLLKLASRNLRRNVRRTAISLTALILGVAVMLLLRGFINGQRGATVELLVDASSGTLQVHKRGYLSNVQALPLTFDMADTPELRAKIAQVSGVTAVAPRITFGSMVAVPDPIVPGREPAPDEQGHTAYIGMTAIDPEAERQVTPRRFEWLDRGRAFSRADSDEILLNNDLNHGLDAPLMQQESAYPPVETWPAIMAADRDGSMNGANIRLVGTMRQALPGDKHNGLVSLGVAQKVLRMPGRITEYALATSVPALDIEHLDQLRDALQHTLGEEYEVSTWQDLIPAIADGMKTQDFVFSMFMGSFLLVALLGIVNTMLMSVLERVREIGTMLAIGTRRGQIIALFILEGFLQGAVGASVGGTLGVGGVLWMGAAGVTLPLPGSGNKVTLHPHIAPSFVAFAVVIAVIGSSVAALYPAWRASKLRPVEALSST